MMSNNNDSIISLVENSSSIQLENEFSKTQLDILYAAEIIMGQKGIENTSHRDIINLAGQKNTQQYFTTLEVSMEL